MKLIEFLIYVIIACIIMYVIGIRFILFLFHKIGKLDIRNVGDENLKREDFDEDFDNINVIYQKLTGDNKVKNKELKSIRECFYSSKSTIEKYVSYCKRKKISLSESDEKTLTQIDEIEVKFLSSKELDKTLDKIVEKYNITYNQVNESGRKLLEIRDKSVSVIESVEKLINSIAQYPKEFSKEISEIEHRKKIFTEAKQFGLEQQDALKKSAIGIEAGVAAGTVVATMAPTAAMWVATTYGTASTGAAISTLSGAAATKAALAWLGGGAISAGGGGVAAGQALLALAGPIGWGIAGGSILLSAVLFWRRKSKINESKKEQIKQIIKYNAKLKYEKEKIEVLIKETVVLEEKLNLQYLQCETLNGSDYSILTDYEKNLLGSLVNNTKSLAILISKVLTENES